jgi:plasmid maintenance system antidote protein VapI
VRSAKPLREWEALAMLQRECDRYKTQKAAAAAFGVSPQHLSDVLNERRAITPKLALGLGYERQALFVSLEHRE